MLQHLRAKVTTNGTSCEAYWTCERAHRLATNLLPVCTSYVEATDSQPRTSACGRSYPMCPSWLSTTLGRRPRRAFGVAALLIAPPPALPSCARVPCQFPAGPELVLPNVRVHVLASVRVVPGGAAGGRADWKGGLVLQEDISSTEEQIHGIQHSPARRRHAHPHLRPLSCAPA